MSEQSDAIASLLSERGAVLPCHRCGKTSFTVLDSFSYYTLQDDLNKGVTWPKAVIPVALVGCDNCGAITPHSLGALGLLKPVEAE